MSSKYSDLNLGTQVELSLNRDQSELILKIHDFGVDGLTDEDKSCLYGIIADMKSQIWP